MAIESMTYLNVPVAKRKASAARATQFIQERLCDPTVSPEQAAKMRDRLKVLEQWATETPKEG